MLVRDAVEFGELAQAHPAVTITKNRLAIDVERLAADVASFSVWRDACRHGPVR